MCNFEELIEPKERDPPNHLRNSKKVEGRQGGEWESWSWGSGEGAQALTAQGLACLLQRSWRVRTPNAVWLIRWVSLGASARAVPRVRVWKART